ncbi:alpha-glucosidase [Austwickia chelonae]|uniref:alpha-glucosidase n=1 Tax=Austwickia chelonae TaxID=100225 RepID=UPI000E271D38|nr:alpha-glucosidase [Austwickia chelonae]
MDATIPGWWKSAVVYQVYPRSFADSDGDGIGDLRGIIDRLDHIADLGVDVLWLSPVYRSPMKDNGYDVADYQAVDPLFGTLADLDELIAAVHDRGMRIVMDIVFNHTSDQHPWFQEALANPESPARDRYWFAEPRAGRRPGEPGGEPTNWLSFFGGPSWTFDPASQTYHLNLFAPEQPDLNWENPELRRELYEILNWWLDRGVDGFRLDVINLVSKRLPLQDGTPIAGTDRGDGHPYGSGFPEVLCGPRIHEFMAEMSAAISRPGVEILTIGETPGVTTDHAVRFTAEHRQELSMVFQFEHMDVDQGPGGRYDPIPVDLVRLKEIIFRWQRELRAGGGWEALYWANHDQPRAVSRFGSDSPDHRENSAKALATVLHLMRGTPFVYQGEELGMTNYPFSSMDEIDDVESRGAYAMALASGRDPAEALRSVTSMSRDHARTPMQWDAGPQGGFTTVTPWLPVNPNHRTINAADQVDDEESVYAHYRRLVALRHELPVIVEGELTPLLAEHPTLWAYRRTSDNGTLTVVANCSDEVCPWPQEEELEEGIIGAGLLLASGPGRSAGPLVGDECEATAELQPWECRVHYR